MDWELVAITEDNKYWIWQEVGDFYWDITYTSDQPTTFQTGRSNLNSLLLWYALTADNLLWVDKK